LDSIVPLAARTAAASGWQFQWLRDFEANIPPPLANPKVPELDSIVPLAARTAAASGWQFQWLRDFEANIPPPL
uniref:hypothetical protein n=1 Tax=Aquitalea magnusonii TaxID=332411 RepID=UPI00195A0258